MDSDLTVVDEPSDVAAADLYVVGVGASAGGLEALHELVRSLPQDISACYVVVQHMSPDHKSLLTMLIARETTLPVLDIESGQSVEPNTIYVTPPNTDVTYRDGKVMLSPPSLEPAAPKPSVDRFLISLAESIAEKAVAIILSGTGSDGAYGVQAVRAAGGITIAQDDKTAKYDGMPIAAVETGCVDLVLSPLQIGTHLSKILSSPRNLDQFKREELTPHPLSDLLQIVLARTRVDFRDYKPTTIQRRLERRMNALGIQSQREYVTFCRSKPAEIDALFKDLLISVTRFFRDPNEFMALRPIIRRIVIENADRTIRVWIGGCATGEEAYSIAMIFAEEMGGPQHIDRDRLQIFATDIDSNALDIARKGRYSLVALEDIPESFAKKYVVVEDEFIFMNKNIRDVVMFSEHNICQDPPFLNLDLVCCRNLLIYFGVSLQIKVLSRLHYSLTNDGFLFLGTAETTTVSEELFRKLANHAHIYRKRMGGKRSIDSKALGSVPPARTDQQTPDARADNADKLFDRALFDSLASLVGPNAILVTDDFRILRVYGDVSQFMRLTAESKLQINTSLLAPELARDARSLTSIAIRRGEHRKGHVHFLPDDPDHAIQLEAFPLSADPLDEDFALLIFNRWKEEPEPDAASTGLLDGATSKHVEALQNELRSVQEELQQTVEELETSNEELQSSNEELQSTNEELQATIEELETSNEELQSTNEELVTVNEELQVSKSELQTIYDEQKAVLASISRPMLIVDAALQVTTANEAAIRFFQIKRPVDRPHLSQLSVPEGFPVLAELSSESMLLGQLKTVVIEVDDQTMNLECSPFFSDSEQVRGATLLIT